MDPLELVKLTALMERTSGIPEIKIGLVDGPVVTQHNDLASEHFREIPGNNAASCTQANSTACGHGTFIAGILSAQRDSPAPAICPNCTLLIRPIFAETTSGREHMPSATPQELAAAILECLNAGARVINLSLALAQPSTKGEHALEEVLNLALRRGVLIVAAAGNQGTLGSSATTATHHVRGVQSTKPDYVGVYADVHKGGSTFTRPCTSCSPEARIDLPWPFSARCIQFCCTAASPSSCSIAVREC